MAAWDMSPTVAAALASRKAYDTRSTARRQVCIARDEYNNVRKEFCQ